MKTKYWFDTEFIEDGKTIDLISIGIVCEDGREFYSESLSCDKSKASEWVKRNVFPHLWSWQDDKLEANRWSLNGGEGGLRYKEDIANGIIRFVANGEHSPEFWAYYADYDWVVLCQLFGTMMDLPDGWPMFCMDVKQLAVLFGDPQLPEQSSTKHHALEDARWTKTAWEFLTHDPPFFKEG